MNGMNTINHEIIPKPCWQSILRIIVKSIITKNFKNAVLYNSLNKSIIICVNENPIYNIAGEQNCIIY